MNLKRYRTIENEPAHGDDARRYAGLRNMIVEAAIINSALLPGGLSSLKTASPDVEDGRDTSACVMWYCAR